MRHFTYAESEIYPVALLVKGSAFNRQEITGIYVNKLAKHSIPQEDVVVIAAEYNASGKAPAPFIKEQLAIILEGLASIGTKYIYCADADYFKVLTKSSKAEPHLGYVLPCKIEGYAQLQVVLGINHKSLIYNPANESKLDMSIATLISCVAGSYQGLGTGIIQHAEYPDTLEKIEKCLGELLKYPHLSCDIEAFSLDHDKAGIGTITFGINQHEGVAFACDYMPFPADMAPKSKLRLLGLPLPPYPNPENVMEGEEDDSEAIYQKRLQQTAASWHGIFVPNSEVRALLRRFFENYTGNLRFHKSTYDMKCQIAALWMEDLLDTDGLLRGLEILTRDFDDTKVIAYLATNTTAGNALGLKALAHEFAGNWAKDEINDIRRIPLPDLLVYNLIDGLSTNYVFDKYYPIMVADNQEEIYRNLMLPSQIVITQMELTGMPLDPVRVQEVKAELQAIAETHLVTIRATAKVKQVEDLLTQRAYDKDFADRKAKAKKPDKILPKDRKKFPQAEFNPDSGPQTQVLLHELLELPIIDTTESGAPATGAKTLEKLVNHTDNPEYKALLEALIGYGQVATILSNFIPAFERAIDKGEDVVWLHGSFNLGGTKSGRLSSSDPNMQNIPATSIYAKLIKSCFKAPDGWIFAGADFTSLEDYISALTTKDPNKLKVYLEGYDGHCLRAFSYWPEKFPGIVETPASVNTIKTLYEEIRQISKAPTFALTYQGTFKTLMNNCGFSEAEAKRIAASYHELYKVSDDWVQEKLAEAAKTGFVEIAFGLRLRTPLLASTISGLRSTPYEAQAEGRTAGNALGQSYGLLNNRAANAFMKRVWASPYRLDIKIIALIHDAIYLLIRNDPDVVAWANKTLIEEMRWQELPEIQHDSVKIGAELSIFWPSWASAMKVPNDADSDSIMSIAGKFKAKYLEKLAA